MESPGGYQLIGRTLPIWNTYTRAGPFQKGKPWLLRNFDQVRFYEVSEDELERLRVDFVNGRMDIDINHQAFDMGEYNRMVRSVSALVRVVTLEIASTSSALFMMEILR